MQENKNRQYYCDTFSEVHAPEKLSRKVMNIRKEKNNKMTFVKKLAVTAASLAALFVGSNAVSYAATGEALFSGFFRDVQRFDGAVIGTEYITVPGEITITAEQDLVTITLNNPEELPFSCMETMTLGDVILTPQEGKEILLTTESFTAAPIEDGIVQIALPTDRLKAGTGYTLSIHSLYGHKKADAPLKIIGEWEVTFPYK